MDKTIRELLNAVSKMDMHSQHTLIKYIQDISINNYVDMKEAELIIAKIIFQIALVSNVENKKTF